VAVTLMGWALSAIIRLIGMLGMHAAEYTNYLTNEAIDHRRSIRFDDGLPESRKICRKQGDSY
jgi:hypothetical protein